MKRNKSLALTETKNGFAITVDGKGVNISNKNMANIAISKEINKLKKQILQYSLSLDLLGDLDVSVPEISGKKVRLAKGVKSKIETTPEFKAAKIKLENAQNIVKAAKMEKNWQAEFSKYKLAHPKSAKSYETFRQEKLKNVRPKRPKMTDAERKAKAKAKYQEKRNLTLEDRAKRLLQRLEGQLEFDDSMYIKIIDALKNLVKRKGDCENLTAEEVLNYLDSIGIDARPVWSTFDGKGFEV